MKVYILDNKGHGRERVFATIDKMLSEHKKYVENALQKAVSEDSHIECSTSHISCLNLEVDYIKVEVVEPNGKRRELDNWNRNFQIAEVEE